MYRLDLLLVSVIWEGNGSKMARLHRYIHTHSQFLFCGHIRMPMLKTGSGRIWMNCTFGVTLWTPTFTLTVCCKKLFATCLREVHKAFMKLRDRFVSYHMADKTHVAKSIRSDLFADKGQRSETPRSSTGVSGSSTERTGMSIHGESFISSCKRWIDFDDDLHLQSFASLRKLLVSKSQRAFCNVL